MDYQKLKKIISRNVDERSSIFRCSPEDLQINNVMEAFFKIFGSEVINLSPLIYKPIYEDPKQRIFIGGKWEPFHDDKPVIVEFEFFIDKDKPQFICGLLGPKGYPNKEIDRMIREVAVPLTITHEITDLGFIISSAENAAPYGNLSKIEQVPQLFREGVVFYSLITLKGPVLDLIRTVISFPKTINFSVELTQQLVPTKFTAYNREALQSKGVLSFGNARIEFKPKVKQIELGADISMEAGPDRVEFSVTGAITTRETQTYGVEFRGVHKPSTSTELLMEWNEPYNFKGITIKELGAKLHIAPVDFTYEFFGKIGLGSDPNDQIILAVAAMLKNGQIPEALVTELHDSGGDGFTLSKLLSYFTVLPSDTLPLNRIIIYEFQLYLVNSPIEYCSPIGCFPPGFGLYVNADLFGYRVKLLCKVIYDKGLSVQAEMDPIHVADVLTVTDASGTKGPLVSIDTTGLNANNEVVLITGAVSLFDVVRQSAYIFLREDAFWFKTSFQVAGMYDFTMACAIAERGQRFQGTSHVIFDFSGEKLEVSWRGVQFRVNLGAAVNGSLLITAKPNDFDLKLDASFEVSNLPPLRAKIKISNKINSLNGLHRSVLEELKKQAADLFDLDDKFDMNIKNFVQLLKDGIVELWEEIVNLAEVLIKWGLDAIGIASLYFDILKKSAVEIFEALQIAGLSFEESIKGFYHSLEKTWGERNEAIAAMIKELKILQNPLDNIANALTIIEVDNVSSLKLLYELGEFTVEQLIPWSRDNWNWNPDQMAEHFSVTLEEFDVSPGKIAEIMGTIGIPQESIQDAFKKVSEKFPDKIKFPDNIPYPPIEIPVPDFPDLPHFP